MSEKTPSLMDRSLVERRLTLWDRVLTEPRYMVGAVGGVGILAVLAWTFLPALAPDELSMGGDSAVFDSRSAASGGQQNQRRKRRSRRLSVLPLEMEKDEAETPVLASASPALPAGGPGSSALVTAPQTDGGAMLPAQGGLGEVTIANTESTAATDAFRAEGTLDKKGFNAKKGGFGGAGGGASAGAGGGGMSLDPASPSASVNKVALTQSLARVAALGPSGAKIGGGQLRASSGLGGGGGQASAIAASGARSARASVGAGDSSGATGQSDGAAIGGASGEAPRGGAASLGGAPEAGADGGAAKEKSAGGGAGGVAPAADLGKDRLEAQATQSDLLDAAAVFAAQADALEAEAARPAAQEVARMADETSAAAAAAVGELNSFAARVQSDRQYFNVTYNYPEIIAPLDSVDEALGDAQDGVIPRLQASGQTLALAAGCLRQVASGALSLKLETGRVVTCMKNAEGGMDQRERDMRKVIGIKRAVDRWGITAKNAVKPLCPLPARQPTLDEKPHCAALDQITASATHNTNKLGAAQAGLDTVQPEANVSNRLPGEIAAKRAAIADRRKALDDLKLPGNRASAVLKGQMAEAILNLDFASGWWRKVAAGSVPPEERAGEAARATSKLVQAIVNLRESSLQAGILAQHAPKKK